MNEYPKMLTINGAPVFVNSAEEEAATKPKRTRRTKAEIEASKAENS